MTAGTKILGTTALLVALVGVGFIGFSILNQPSDRQLIQEAIKEATKASREGSAGGVLDYLSKDLSVNDAQVTGSRSDVGDYIRKLKPDIEFTSIEPLVFDAEAKVESPVKVTLGFLGAAKTFDIPKATVTLKKESSMNFFVIPIKKWRITNISIPMDSMASMIPSF